MADETKTSTPQSPEVQDAYVRDELEQDDVSHKGEWRTGSTAQQNNEDASKSLGATEDEVVPIIAPMSGPADVVGEKHQNAQGNETGHTGIGEEHVDPRDELTPG